MMIFVDDESLYFLDKDNRLYEITSSPQEPMTYINKDCKLICGIRHGFETAEIKKLLVGGEPLRSMSKQQINQGMLCEVFSAAIASGRNVQLLDKLVDLVLGIREEKKQKKALTAKKIEIMRDSVCMGDDCHAPHKSELVYYEGDRLSQLMKGVIEYLPKMGDATWEVNTDGRTLALLFSNPATKYSCQLQVSDAKVEDLKIRRLFCKYN